LLNRIVAVQECDATTDETRK